jgi:hypothetical protein
MKPSKTTPAPKEQPAFIVRGQAAAKAMGEIFLSVKLLKSQRAG